MPSNENREARLQEKKLFVIHLLIYALIHRKQCVTHREEADSQPLIREFVNCK